MVRVRKLVLAIAAASALSSGMAHALGVGELTLQSSLNQPLVAEIELLDVRDLSAQEVRSLLASQEEFGKAGVDRQYFLTDLTFTPIVRPNGKSVIRVTSSKPVREPYLNFLVEVQWPTGRVLREYTLLLDPPLYSPQAAAAPQLPAATPAVRQPAPAAAPPAPRTSAPASAPAPRAAGSESGGEYRTTTNDTLWEVAQRVRGNGSVHQAMLAIQDLNPSAFIGGNINRMKAGQVLRLPDESQVAGRTQSQALAQVGEQNAAWRQARSAPAPAAARQIDATRRASAGAAPADVPAQDKLKLLAAEAGQSTAGSEGGSNASKALSDELAITQESLDSTRRENDELKDRMNDLQGQLDKLQRLIALKDNQLAKLQADMGTPAATTADTPAAQPRATAPQPAPEPPAPEQPASAGSAAPSEASPPAAQGAPEASVPAEEPAAPSEAAPASVEQPTTASELATAEPAAPAAATETPDVPASTEPQDEDSALDNLLANPMLLGLIGGSLLLALLLVLLILSRRNARKEAEREDSLLTREDEDSHRFDSDMELPADSLDDLSDDLLVPVAASGEERTIAQTGDALGEADIYIAYGRFNQAAELLHTAIDNEPERTDLRLKLMEVYAELGDRDGFARQENEVREIGGAQAEVEQLKSRYPAMVVLGGATLAGLSAADDLDAFSLDDLGLDEPARGADIQPSTNHDFDLDLDALEAEFAAAPAAQPLAPVTDFEEEKDSLSFDTDLDELAAEPLTSREQESTTFDLDQFDDLKQQELGGELADFSLDLDAPATPAAAQEDEFLLSLDDEAEKPSANDDLLDIDGGLPQTTVDDFDLPADFDLSLGDETPSAAPEGSFSAQLDEVTAELDQLAESLEQQGQLEPQEAQTDTMSLDDDEDFDFLSGTDETATKLDLARAYIDMGDSEGARDILDEVIAEGNEGQQQEARELIGKLV